MIDPYVFIRGTTIILATVWTITGVLRMARLALRWQCRLSPLGFGRTWLARQVVIVTARATVLDPVNLALFMLLVGIWTMGGSIPTRIG